MTSGDYIFLSALILTHSIVTVTLFHLYARQQRLRKVLPLEERKKAVKVLSVVAGHDLDTTEIEKALYTTDINYNLLSFESVNQESLLRELEKEVTVFELSSHGLNGHFRLGNATIPITWLASALKQCKDLECVLLLYCNSYLDLGTLSKTGRFVVGLVGDVSDTSCITFARHFYYYLSRKYNYQEAFEASRLHLPVADFGNFISDGKFQQSNRKT